MFSDLQFGANTTKRTKDRITRSKALIVSASNGGHDTAAVPGGLVRRAQRRRHAAWICSRSIRPTGLVNGRDGAVSKYNDDILSKSWSVKENVSTMPTGKLDIDTDVATDPGARQRRPAVRLHRPVVRGLPAPTSARAVVLTNPALTKMTSFGTRYSNVLPTLNLTADLGSGNLLRFGAGIELARLHA